MTNKLRMFSHNYKQINELMYPHFHLKCFVLFTQNGCVSSVVVSVQRQMLTFFCFIQLFDETKSLSILYQDLRIFLEYIYEEYIWNIYLILSGLRFVEPF